MPAADWPKWRGPNDDGCAEPGDYPVSIGADENLLWKVALPGVGSSTPVLRGDRIYLTAPVKGANAVLCFDRAGNLKWQTSLGPERKGKHKNGSGSNPSVALGEDGLFACYRSGEFAALDLDGKVRWKTNLVDRFGEDTLYFSYGTSPVVTANHVIATRMQEDGSWLAAFDQKTGELAWKVARNYETPKENDHSYNTPLVVRENGREALLVWGAEHLTVHDAADGKVMWSCGGFNKGGDKNWPVVACPVVVDDMVVVCFGRSDRKRPALHGIRRGGSGDVTKSHRVWDRDDTGSFVPTPAVRNELVYLVQDLGSLDCVDPVNGKVVWRGEFPRSKAKFYASPVIAGDRLYAARDDGVVFVVGVKDGFKLLASNEMGEKVVASPVLVDGRVLIRGEKHLYCFGSE